MRIIYLMFLAYALAACGSEQPTTETAATDNTEAHAHDHSHEGHDHAHDHGGEEPKSKDGIHYGEDITAEGALMLNEVADKLAKGEETQDLDLGEGNVVKALDAKVAGTVSEVCKAAGCWLRIKNEEGVEMFVNTNHDFLVDQTIIGKKVVVKGNAYGEEKTVAELQAIAKDAGKSEEEVAAITEAQVDYSLMAKGLIVQ